VRTLGAPDRHGSEMARGPLECQPAGAVSEERTDPLDQVWADPFITTVKVFFFFFFLFF